LPYGYLRLDPALGAALLRKLDAGQREAARAAWAQTMLAFTGYLYQQTFKDPQMAATLTLLDLPNLLAALEYLCAVADTGSGVVFGQGSLEVGKTSAENDSRPLLPSITFDAVVGMATQLEGLLQNLGRPRALARVAKLRAQAAERLGQWSHARYLAESAAVDRLLDAGRVGEAYEAAQAVLERALSAGEDAYDVAAYDIAMAHFRLGRMLKMGGAAEAALTPIAEARRRFQRLAEAGNQDAARMASVCLTESGDCLRNLGRLDEAAAAYEAAIGLAEQRGDPRDVATNKGQLGTVRMLQRRYPEALAAFTEARQTFEQLGEPATVATAWHQIGMVYQEAQQYESAESAYQESLKIGCGWASVSGRGGDARPTRHRLRRHEPSGRIRPLPSASRHDPSRVGRSGHRRPLAQQPRHPPDQAPPLRRRPPRTAAGDRVQASPTATRPSLGRRSASCVTWSVPSAIRPPPPRPASKPWTPTSPTAAPAAKANWVAPLRNCSPWPTKPSNPARPQRSPANSTNSATPRHSR
jgi:tetratricopeptide (TPR) repeat protein